MRPSLLLAAVVGPLLAACAAAPTGPSWTSREAAPRQFGFSPPVGLVERAVDTRSPPVEVERLTVELTTTFSRTEAGTFRLRQTVTSASAERGGAAHQPPELALLLELPVELELAADGSVLGLVNPDEIDAVLARLFPNEGQAEVMRRFFGPPVLEGWARREWDAKYGGLFGADLAPGSHLDALDAVHTEDGGIHWFLLRRTLEGTMRTGFGEALVFTLSCPPEGAIEEEALRRRMDALGVERLASGVACSGRQIVAVSPFTPVRYELTFQLGEGASAMRHTRHVETLKRD